MRRRKDTEFQERWVIVDGRPVFSRVSLDQAPTGSMPVVFVHGFGISGTYFLPTARLLAKQHPVYIPDLPGYGRSPDPDRPLTVPQLARSLASYMDEVGLERAVLCGNSMGCLVTIEFAGEFPDHIHEAILVSPAGGPYNRPFRRALGQLVRDGVAESPRMALIVAPDYWRFGLIDSLRLFSAMTRYQVIEAIRDTSVPVLCVIGRRDPLVSLDRLMALIDEFQDFDITLVQLEGAAHAINFSHGPELSALTCAFLARQSIELACEAIDAATLVGLTETARKRVSPSEVADAAIVR